MLRSGGGGGGSGGGGGGSGSNGGSGGGGHHGGNCNGGGSGGGGGGGADAHDPQDIRIVVLGAQGVGKTSLVQQFVHCACPDGYTVTRRPVVHRPCITVNDRTYETRLIDCPPLRYFPTNSLQEFSDFRGYGLRSASGYVLVYDLTDEPTFGYVRRIREQLLEQGIDAPVLVVANKADLLGNGANGNGNGGGGGGGGGFRDKDFVDTVGGVLGGRDKDKSGGGEARREASNQVRKQWKCLYVECSAKYNWHVSSAFRELLKAIDHKDFGHKPTSARVQEAFRRNQCLLM